MFVGNAGEGGAHYELWETMGSGGVARENLFYFFVNRPNPQTQIDFLIDFMDLSPNSTAKYLPLLKQKVHSIHLNLWKPFISRNIWQMGKYGFNVLFKNNLSGRIAVNEHFDPAGAFIRTSILIIL